MDYVYAIILRLLSEILRNQLWGKNRQSEPRQAKLLLLADEHAKAIEEFHARSDEVEDEDDLKKE